MVRHFRALLRRGLLPICPPGGAVTNGGEAAAVEPTGAPPEREQVRQVIARALLRVLPGREASGGTVADDELVPDAASGPARQHTVAALQTEYRLGTRLGHCLHINPLTVGMLIDTVRSLWPAA